MLQDMGEEKWMVSIYLKGYTYYRKCAWYALMNLIIKLR